MKITEVETLLMDEFPNLTFVRLHTDEGIVGLGETFFTADAVASWIHSMAAPYLLGKDPLRLEHELVSRPRHQFAQSLTRSRRTAHRSRTRHSIAAGPDLPS